MEDVMRDSITEESRIVSIRSRSDIASGATCICRSLGIVRNPLTSGAWLLVAGAVTAAVQPALASPLFTEYQVPTPASVPCNTISGPDNAVWYEELADNKIGRLDPATGSISEFTIPSPLPTAPAPEIVSTLNA